MTTTVEMPWPAIGRVMQIRPDTSDQRVVEDCWAGYHIPPEHLLFEPGTVLDLGANIGATTAWYEWRWPRALVAAVEMDANNVEVLSLNCRADVYVGAVAAKPGPRYYDPALDAEALRLGEGSEHSEETVGVPLDAIIQHYWVGGVDFVKMDIEGAEWEVFDVGDEWAPLVHRLLVELHPYGAPDPPDEPWPVGRDGPSPLVAAAIRRLSELSYRAVPHTIHPHAVWACR